MFLCVFASLHKITCIYNHVYEGERVWLCLFWYMHVDDNVHASNLGVFNSKISVFQLRLSLICYKQLPPLFSFSFCLEDYKKYYTVFKSLALCTPFLLKTGFFDNSLLSNSYLQNL